LLMLVAVSVFAAPGIVMTRSETADLTFPIIGIVAWASFFVGSMIPSGFRGDLDAIDWFKMLPIRPAALVVGELLPPVLFVSALPAGVLAGCALRGIAAQSAVVAAAVCYALPVNLLFVSTENLLFLRYPSRLVATSPGDFQFMGRQMAMMLARMLLIFAACGIAGLVIGALWLAGVQSRPILAAV